jgi:shikimate dehydrogenase
MEPFLIPSPKGSTRLYAVIGNPVAQVQAPALLNRIFADEGIDAVMVPVQASPDRLGIVIDGLKNIGNLDGILITIPHKFAAVDHLDRMSSMVELAGSTNALRREADGSWLGENFDGLGFVAGLRKHGHELVGKTIALIGAGGAGAAIAPALLDAGAVQLHLTDVTEEKALALATRLNRRWPGAVEVSCQPRLDGADIVINATPLGLREDDPLPFQLGELKAEAVVADIIMKPAETKLLRQAEARGHAIHHGIHMLSEQIGLYRSFFGF